LSPISSVTWALDMPFGEDAHRARQDHSAANPAIIRRATLKLLRDNSGWTLNQPA
jgi:predicted transposase YbfD/YdcC